MYRFFFFFVVDISSFFFYENENQNRKGVCRPNKKKQYIDRVKAESTERTEYRRYSNIPNEESTRAMHT